MADDLANAGDSTIARFDALRDAVDKTLGKLESMFSNKFMAKCYSSTAKKYPETIEMLRTTMMEGIRKKVIEDLEAFYEDLNLKQNLNLIDSLETEQKSLSLNERVWRPTGVPSRDLLAHDLPVHQSFAEHLKTLVSEMNAQVEEKKEAVTEIVNQIETETKEIKELTNSFQVAINILNTTV